MVSLTHSSNAITEHTTTITTQDLMSAETTALFLIAVMGFAIQMNSAMMEYTTTTSSQVLAEPTAKFLIVVMVSLTIPTMRSVMMVLPTQQTEDVSQVVSSTVDQVFFKLEPPRNVIWEMPTPMLPMLSAVPPVHWLVVVMVSLILLVVSNAIALLDVLPTVPSSAVTVFSMLEKIVITELPMMTPLLTLAVPTVVSLTAVMV